MLVLKSNWILGIAVATALSTTGWAQAEKKKDLIDRAEYDLVQAIGKETAPAKKVELLQQWKQKYPETAFKLERLGMFLGAYQALGRAAEMLATAKELTTLDLKGVDGYYWICALTISMANTSADALDTGEKAGKTLLANLDEAFAPAKKPAQEPDAQWTARRKSFEMQAHNTLGWVAMQRKSFEDAEKAFMKSLELVPNNGQVSYWLGTSLLGTKKADKQFQALYHFARAAAYSGEGALNEAGRKQVQSYLEKIYTQYRGDKSELDSLLAKAKDNPLPGGFYIKNKLELQHEAEEKFKESNPQLALWMTVKKELVTPQGAKYFEDNVKGTALPKLRGKVIATKPVAKPKEIVVAIVEANTPEITLKLETAMATKADPGTEIEFEGVPSAFTPEPFMLTVDVEGPEKISGWPAPPKPAAKKPAAKKPAPQK